METFSSKQEFFFTSSTMVFESWETIFGMIIVLQAMWKAQNWPFSFFFSWAVKVKVVEKSPKSQDYASRTKVSKKRKDQLWVFFFTLPWITMPIFVYQLSITFVQSFEGNFYCLLVSGTSSYNGVHMLVLINPTTPSQQKLDKYERQKYRT